MLVLLYQALLANDLEVLKNILEAAILFAIVTLCTTQWSSSLILINDVITSPLIHDVDSNRIEHALPGCIDSQI